MDHYIPKRRIPVTLWSGDLKGLQGWISLDLDAAGNRHQTVLERLNETSRFLPVAVGDDGRILLVNKHRVSRVTTGRQVIQSDVFARGFQPWREEEAEVTQPTRRQYQQHRPALDVALTLGDLDLP